MKKILSILFVAALCCIVSAAEISAPWNGSIDLKGTGKFAFRNAKLNLLPGKSYRFDFKISKHAPLSAKKQEHQLVLYSVSNNKHRTLKTFAGDVPGDGKTYQVSSALTIPADAKGDIMLFVYNCFASGVVSIKDFKISELGDAEKITAATATYVADEVKADPNTVMPKLSNGQRALLEGNGRFLFLSEKIALKPGQTYNFSCDICKVPQLSYKVFEHRIVFSLTDSNGKYSEFAHFGENVPVDKAWHKVTGSFTTPKKSGTYTMYIYNCNADGSMEVKNIKLQATDAAPVQAPAPKIAASTAQSMKVVGNGKFTGDHFHVTVKPNRSCTFTFKMKKTPKMSSNPAEQRVVIAYIPNVGQIREIGYIGENLPADSKWHDMQHTVQIPADSNGTLRVYIYNCNATGTIEIKDFVAKQ